MAEVLLVDDDSSVLLTLSIALRRRGHAVTMACDAQQALKQLARRRFDFLVSDIRMPDMSGLELASRVQGAVDAPRIVLTSAHYDPQLAPNPVLSHVEEFLSKPIDVEKLDALLSRSQKPHPPRGGKLRRLAARRPRTPRLFRRSTPLPQAG
jgi:DNA-binding NtrC family response regulator